VIDQLKRHAGSIVVAVLVLYGLYWVSRRSSKIPTFLGD
jgi:hypothetical protein